MNETDEGYWLLSRPSGIEKTRSPHLQRHLGPGHVRFWLKAGWRDLMASPLSSLGYGLLVAILSALTIFTFVAFGLDYILFPALSGFLIVAPLLAMGLYQKSALREKGDPAGLADMLAVRARAGGQIFFVGLLLALLAMVWLRAAVLIYALFFGYRAFPGTDELIPVILHTPEGWGMLVTGIAVGGLFAAFAFAVSAFSVPMLLDRDTDALSAMGKSMAVVWNNLPVMLAWGSVVLALTALSIATGLLGLIIVFPLLGHATWHAYREMVEP